MTRLVTTILFCLAAALSAWSPAAAASDEEIFAQIEALHGNAGSLDPKLMALRAALTNDDAAALAALADYPLRVNANGESYDILSADDLIENYDALITQETKDAVAAMEYGDLVVTSEGVGLADGAVWMGYFCNNTACARSHWALMAINN